MIHQTFVVDAHSGRLLPLATVATPVWGQVTFRVSYNEGFELITIRYYDQATIDRVLVDKTLLLEQKSRYTVQLVVRP